MIRGRFAVVLPILTAAAAVCAPAPAPACDSTACMMMTRGQNGVIGRRSLRLDLSFRYTEQDQLLAGSAATASVLRPKVDFERQRIIPGYHGERGGHESFLQLDASYGVSRRLTLVASAPLLVHRSYQVVHSQFVHQYETTGFGDMVVAARYALDPGARVVAGFAVKLPTGDSHLLSPFDGGIHDPMLQPGTGSSDMAASVQASRRAFSVDWALSGSYQANTTNELGYRYGNDAIATLSATRPLLGGLSGSVQLKTFFKRHSTYRDEEVPSTGGKVVYLTPGLRWSTTSSTGVYAFVQVPVYRYVNDEQLAPTVGVLIGLTRTFP
jgi:hypothetical protein